MVEPVLYYGASIWGQSEWKEINTVQCNTIGGTLPQNDRVSHEIHEDIILKHIVVFSIVVLEAY